MLCRLRGDFRLRTEKVCPAFWPILLPHSTVFLFRCKDNIAHDYSRYCDPSTCRREYSNTGTYSVGSLTTQKRKESEEPLLLGRSQGIIRGKSPALMSRVKCSHARGLRKSGFHVVESKDLPPALECCSSSERCRSLDCLMLCLLKPKERG